MSNNAPQILRSSLSNGHLVADSIKVFEYENGEESLLVELTPQLIGGVYTPLAIKANKVIYGSAEKTPVIEIKYAEDGTIDDVYYNCQLKVFDDEPLKDVTNGKLNLHNYGEGAYTKVSFEEMPNVSDDTKEPPEFASINAIIPEGNFGLIMFYNSKIGKDTRNIAIRLVNSDGENIAPAIYNNRDSDEGPDAWWTAGESIDVDGGGTVTVYRLRKGINVVKISESCSIQIFPDHEKKDVLIFGDLDIVNYDLENGPGPINSKLSYKQTNVDGEGLEAIERQILHDIRTIDSNHDFYYNALMNNDTELDLNPKDDADTLENPLNWYNYNNVANKFVVSEIDADYLPTGITIAKNSRL